MQPSTIKVQVGTAEYEAVKGYKMDLDLPEQFDASVDYYAFLKKTSPEAVVRLSDAPLPGFKLNFKNSQDLIDYTELIITQEKKGSAIPVVPVNSKYSGTQTQVIPTAVPTLSVTGLPTIAPTGGGGGTTAPTSGAPLPTGGGPSVLDQIKAVVSNISQSKIQEYLTNISNKEGATDEKQTRFSGTQGNLDEQAYLIKYFQDLGYEVDTSQTYSYTYKGGQISSKNIIARLYGQKRDSFYLMTAHMDSTAERDGSRDPAPGVDDNGSGTVSVMEVARAFKLANIQPQHSIEFILFSGEEQGLHGSSDYVSRLTPDKKIRAVINLDMIGNIDPSGDCVNFYFKPGTGGNLITDVMVQVVKDANIPLKTKSEEWGITRSDHGPFWTAGINTAIFGHECKSGADGGVYHSLSDKMNAVNVSQITHAAQAVGGALVKMSQEGIGQQVTNELNLAPLQGGGGDVLGLANDAQAAEKGTILAVVPFRDLTEIDTLITNTSTYIDYIMGKDVPDPQFLGLFSQDQITVLEQLGYKPRIVDPNADLSQYVFLYHPSPDQGDKLLSIGDIFAVNPNYFLVKLAPGQEFSNEGVLGEFFDLEMPQNSAPPPYRTPRITLAPTPTGIPQPTDVKASTSSTSRGSVLLIGLLLFVALVIAAIFAYVKIVRKDQTGQTDITPDSQ
jgi:Zn-dependent M28 family amino/carboxypeptidase